GFGNFGDLFRAGRMLGDGDLRLIALALIAEQPRHGYDIIRAIEERTHGSYAPSPGVVYPTLSYLEEAGFAVSAAEGNKRVYAITDEGRAHLVENRARVDAVIEGMERFGRRMEKAREWFDRMQSTGEDFRERGPRFVPELDAARRRLRTAIAALEGAPDGVQRHAAEILARAAAELERRPE